MSQRPLRPLYVFALGGVLACTAREPGSSPTGGESATSTAGTATTDVDSGTGSVDDTSDEGADAGSSDTTGEPQSGSGRFLTFSRGSNGRGGELLLYEYVDGELLPPQPVNDPVPVGAHMFAVDVVAQGQAVDYCVSDIEDPWNQDCFVVDLSQSVPGEPQSLISGGAEAADAVAWVRFVPVTQTFIYTGYAPSDDPQMVNPAAGIYAATYHDGELGYSQQIFSFEHGHYYSEYADVSSDGGSYSLVLWPGTGTDLFHVHSASIVDPDPAETLIYDVTNTEHGASEPTTAAGGQAMAFREGLRGFWNDEIHYVDLSGPTPAEPVHLGAALGLSTFGPPLFSPDGNTLAYTQHWYAEDGARSDLFLVDVDAGVPPTPVAVQTDLVDRVSTSGDLGWSLDSRWIVFRVGSVAGARQYHLVDRSAAGQIPPFSLADEPEVEQRSQWFDDTSTWLYYEQDDVLTRRNVTGAEPGPPQTVSDDGMSIVSIHRTHDPSSLMYTASGPGTDELSHWVVDIGGEQPGGLERIDAPSADGWHVVDTLEPAWDASFALYHECSHDPCSEGISRLRLVDRNTGLWVEVPGGGATALAVAK
ncbi:MAG: hypothetical protein AAF799_47290 [Myxococcota bacterium]